MFHFKTSSLHSAINFQIGRRIKHKEAGVTNTQVAIVTLVGVILLLGSLGGFQYIGQAKVSNEIATLSDLRAATVRYGQTVGTFTTTNLTVPILAGFNFFASSGLSVSGTGTTTAVANQWGGTVSPSVGTSATLGDSITFTFSGVSSSACKELGTKVDKLASTVSINSVQTKAVGAATLAAGVLTNCKATDDNSVAYTFLR